MREAESEILTLRRSTPDGHNFVPRGGYQPRSAPDVRQTYSAFEANRQKHARHQRYSDIRYNRMAISAASAAAVPLDDMDLDDL